MAEYMNKDFQELLKNMGIYHECSAPYTPQQNGRSERELKTIVECARTMLINKQVPQELWAEAVNTAVYILNRTASSQIDNITAYEKWFGKKPETKHLRIFGSPAYMSVPPQFRKKWDSKSRKLMFVGYEGYSTNYRLWDFNKRRIEVSCNVNFNEDGVMNTEKEPFVFTLKFGQLESEENNSEPPNDTLNSANCSDENDSDSTGQTEFFSSSGDDEFEDSQVNPHDSERRELRNRTTLPQPKYLEDYYGILPTVEPSCYEEAINSTERNKWFQAMQEEMDALKANNTWNLVKLPKNAKTIDNKWVFA